MQKIAKKYHKCKILHKKIRNKNKQKCNKMMTNYQNFTKKAIRQMAHTK